ncbi:MAG: 1-(5-phosphoribosyl)-5-[(5-phosphoribosylamino)methylideneamino]imidazole-4-carboxamide isomerase [Ruminococcaceae bacterium]|nr:1-(5-phosphoribosyl)-5-[(5-phosphoribosylamino)methylideneamino]imidazole-4-carboxamide isomerase [Oscillospiraceae bacterium]
MEIFPAIDLYDKKAVRLYKGDYNNMTVYSDKPWEIAEDFKSNGAKHIHIVDLEGAKSGETPNIDTIKRIVDSVDLFVEVGGGIRSMEVIDKYASIGVNRVILGTAAVENEEFLKEAIAKYGDMIAVGIDIKDGYVAIKGWTEKSQYSAFEFVEKMQNIGVKTIICTDISKDGAMKGTNLPLYKELSEKYHIDIIASGGVSTLDDIKGLRKMDIYGTIVGKAYYTKAISIKEAIEVAK